MEDQDQSIEAVTSIKNASTPRKSNMSFNDQNNNDNNYNKILAALCLIKQQNNNLGSSLLKNDVS